MTTLMLQQERALILQQMAHIDCLIRGHLSEQTYQVPPGKPTRTQGPYYLLQRREAGKNNCQRVGPDELDAIVAGIQGYQRFQQLAARYAALTEQMTWDQQRPDLKKKFQRFWKATSLTPPPS